MACRRSGFISFHYMHLFCSFLRKLRADIFVCIIAFVEFMYGVSSHQQQDLMKWLRQKKDEGYTIVGLEQTSTSTSLHNHQFDSKTVLLLGKEKEGIPVEYLQLVDTCLEVPQLGIIRSLNVHVTGAISIWEYTKQHLKA